MRWRGTLYAVELQEMRLFTSRIQPVAPPPPISEAEHFSVSPPKLSPEHLAGLQAAAQIGAERENAKLAAYEAARDARAAAASARDDALWAKIVARNRAAIG
jgi:hypothetical protein